MRLQQSEVDKLKWISSLKSINKGKKVHMTYSNSCENDIFGQQPS